LYCFVAFLAFAAGAAGLFVAPLSLLEQRGQDAGERYDESDQKKPEAHGAPERDVAWRAWLVSDVCVGDAAGDKSEDDEAACEDVEIAAHADRSILLDASCRVLWLEKLFDIGDVLGEAVRRERFEEDAAVALSLDARVEEHEDAAVVQAADEATESLLERDYGVGDLVVEEGLAAESFNGFHPGLDYRVRGDGEG
jgi:hypothetical protein